MKIEMQRQFRMEHAIALFAILYPDINIEGYKITYQLHPNYTWVLVSAYKHAKYSDNKNRTPETMIERSHRLSFGIDSHHSSLYGMGIKPKPEDISINLWKFIDDHTNEIKFTQEQIQQATKYLNSVGIHRASIKEFLKHYYKD